MPYRFFFLCRFLRRRFLRLCVAILWRLRFLPQGIGTIPSNNDGVQLQTRHTGCVVYLVHANGLEVPTDASISRYRVFEYLPCCRILRHALLRNAGTSPCSLTSALRDMIDTHPIREIPGHRYFDTSPDLDTTPVVLLHGLLGVAMEWNPTIEALAAERYRVVVPLIPVDSQECRSNLSGVVDYVRSFAEELELSKMLLVGNSLGGQIALWYCLRYPEEVVALVLSGSSGLFEVEVGTITLRRRDRNFIRERAARTFYDPVHVTDELVERIYELANDRARALRILRLARSSLTEVLNDELRHVHIPTQLIWGRNDQITPPEVASTFERLLPYSELHFIDKCGHAPMMERPETFNRLVLDFLGRTIGAPVECAESAV